MVFPYIRTKTSLLGPFNCLDDLIHITTHELPNISRSKGYHTMKYGRLIECNMRNIFLEKSYTKHVGETSPRLFSEKLKLNISLDQ